MKRLSVLTLAAAAACLVAFGLVARSAAAPVSDSRADQTTPLLRVGWTIPFSTLDSHRRCCSAAFAARLGLETLMQLGPDGRVRPLLARSVRQPGPLTYVYTLRRGVRFWNGNELTAVDVANALNYYRHPSSTASFTFGTSVRDIRATGRYTVVIRLKRRDASWPFVVSSNVLGIFEKKFADDHKERMGQPGVLTMGTGPYRFDTFDPTRGLELLANRSYWGGRVPIERISIRFFSDENNLALAFRAGEIDTAPSIVSPRAFVSTSGSRLIGVTSPSSGVFGMNARVAPWRDVHVRRAVAYALNRRDIITANGGFATPSFTLIPPMLLRSLGSKADVDKMLRSLPQYPFNLARARQEMARSAYPNGFTATIPVYIVPDISQVIAAQLRRIGIRLELETVSVGAWVSEATGPPAGRRPVFMTAGCASPDPGRCYDYFLGSRNAREGGFNVANYAPPAVDELIKAGFQATDPSKRLAVYGKLLRRLALDVPYVSLYLEQSHLALSSRFTWPTYNSFWWNRAWALEIKPR